MYQKINSIDPKSHSKAINVLDSGDAIVKSFSTTNKDYNPTPARYIQTKSPIERLNSLPRITGRYDEYSMNYIFERWIESANNSFDKLMQVNISKWKQK